MRDPTLQLLQVCAELGLLALRDLYVEVALLAAGKEFIASEIIAHALLPENHRLHAALTATCGADFGAAEVGKLFAKYVGANIGGIAITSIGEEGNAIVWSCQSQPEHVPSAESDTIGALPIALGKRYAR